MRGAAPERSTSTIDSKPTVRAESKALRAEE